MNFLYQKYNIVIEAMIQVVSIIPTSSCNVKNMINRKTIADGFVFSIYKVYLIINNLAII